MKTVYFWRMSFHDNELWKQMEQKYVDAVASFGTIVSCKEGEDQYPIVAGLNTKLPNHRDTYVINFETDEDPRLVIDLLFRQFPNCDIVDPTMFNLPAKE